MKAAIPKPQRCAIYTRKSTEHNLDLAFSSLDAQREACEARDTPPPRAAPAPAAHGTGAAFKDSGRIVIVGASLAGLRAAETLRAEGFRGPLTLIGDEPYLPYDRPPLTKAVLTGRVPAEHTQLPRRATLTDVEWRLGVAATGLDRSAKQIRLADGQSVAFDRLLIATGARARPWFNQAEGSLAPRRQTTAGAGHWGRVHRVGDCLRLLRAWSAGHAGRTGDQLRWWGRWGASLPTGSPGCSSSTGSICVVR
jgi:Pyridine nucleotide-disulphide oxidoreductase